MAIFLMILKILGIILLSVIGLIIFLLLVILILSIFKVRFVLSYDEDFKFSIKYIFFKFKLFPPKEESDKKKRKDEDKPLTIEEIEKQTKKEIEEEEKRIEKEKEEFEKEKQKEEEKTEDKELKEEGKKKKNIFEKALQSLDFFDYIEIIKIIFDKFLFKFEIEELLLDIKVATDNAADTAMAYGKMNAIIYPIVGILHGNDKIKNANIRIEPDFNSNTPEYKAYTEITTRVFYLIKCIFLIVLYIWKKRKN